MVSGGIRRDGLYFMRGCPRQMSCRIITAKSTDGRNWAKAGLVLEVEGGAGCVGL